MSAHCNFLHKSILEGGHPEDRHTYFDDEPVVLIDDSWTMADVMVASGRAPSKTQARKMGLPVGRIPPGWTFDEKNKRKPYYILNAGVRA